MILLVGIEPSKEKSGAKASLVTLFSNKWKAVDHAREAWISGQYENVLVINAKGKTFLRVVWEDGNFKDGQDLAMSRDNSAGLLAIVDELKKGNQELAKERDAAKSQGEKYRDETHQWREAYKKLDTKYKAAGSPTGVKR